MKVTVEKFRDKLRIRFTHKGKRYCIALGVKDSPSTKAYAGQLAKTIELDILSNNFDETLLNYRPHILGQNPTEISVPELFKRFTEYQFKAKGLAPGSRRRYQPIQSCLETRLNIPAHSVCDRMAGNYAAQILERLTSRTAKERLWMLASCWDWAKTRYRIAEVNPWTVQVQRIKPSVLGWH